MNNPVSGLRAVLGGLIDYAGLFPPASLSLEEALETHLRDIQGSDSWMLAGFVLPVGRMQEAAQILDAVNPLQPILFSALGSSGSDWDAFFNNLDKDIEQIDSFRKKLGGNAIVNGYETRLPGPELDFQIRSDAVIQKATEMLANSKLTPFFEVPFDQNWETRSERAIRSIQSVSKSLPARYKIRTGGVEKNAFPTPGQLAWAILEAGRMDVAFKCTAGLHHPIRHFDVTVGTKMHGFINVFAGGILAGAHRLSQAELEMILAEEDADQFAFDNNGLSWRQLSASVQEIEQYRHGAAISVGSCSFDDPRQDMKKLGWL